MDELTTLYEQKGNTRDKVELRKIRARIRRELRKRGEYTSTKGARGYTAPRRKRPDLTDEEYAHKRTRAIKNKQDREEKAGQRSIADWKRLGPLHTKRCRCVACVISNSHLKDTPEREDLLRWYKTMKIAGHTGISREWLEKAWISICGEGKIPRSDKAKAFLGVIKTDGWY